MSTLIPRLSVAALKAPRAHLKQYDPRCDTVTVLNMAARRRPGRRVADMNAVAGYDDDWNLHWPEGPELNHFTHRINPVTHKLERMPEHLRHKPVLETPRAEIRLWRKSVGTARRPKWVAPFTCAERQKQANRRLVTIAWELKSPVYGIAAYARRMANSLKDAGGKFFVFTLATMAEWQAKLTAFHSEGIQTGLDANGAVEPKNIHQLHPGAIDVILGHFRKAA